MTLRDEVAEGMLNHTRQRKKLPPTTLADMHEYDREQYLNEAQWAMDHILNKLTSEGTDGWSDVEIAVISAMQDVDSFHEYGEPLATHHDLWKAGITAAVRHVKG